ncbi:MAG: phenylalanine--tRNA ligase subunit alpha [Candidatus Marinimicrobia bacterium]|nr:phenylalanine--tRNA ligase subunit alpha [Candidatus Neomarinimicrobiota bacterium]
MNLLERTNEVRSQLKEDLLKVQNTFQSIEDFRLKYIGKKGRISSLFLDFSALGAAEKRDLGKILNILKKDAEEAVQNLKDRFADSQSREGEFDYTLPGMPFNKGHLHPVTQTMNRICDIFQEIGFGIEFGPEVETDFYNFKALNFPDNHPARDMQDTFFIEDDILLRTHTSPVQIRTMLKQKPPIRILAPGRVFRNEAINSRSYCVFHQVEGLYVDENVTFGELKVTIEVFAKKFFGKDVQLRFRPSYFPFTEPSAEVDISCIICGGKGCRLCKHTGWLEIMGCGMVDPSVLNTCGIDSEKYTGYAFGMGPDRITLLKYGINDIRLLFEGDIRFLRQF